MDIFTHAVVGGFTGAVFGQPVAGAAIAIIPDICLGVKRKAAPTQCYNFTHSFLYVGIVSSLCGLLYGEVSFWVTFLALLSHICLDMPTHGNAWAPQLWFPFGKRYSYGREWEFFNESWWRGFEISCLWVAACLPFILLK